MKFMACSSIARYRMLILTVFSIGFLEVVADNRYHDLEFLVEESSIKPSDSVNMITERNEAGDVTGYLFAPKDPELTEFEFTVKIPPDGLLQGTASGSAQGIVAVAGHFSSSADFSFKNVTWPEDLPPNWELNSEYGANHEAKITVTLNSEDENAEPSAELELDGEGSIQTLDWSSHQRRIAEEEEQSAWEKFSDPDGVGRVQALDNPPVVLLSILSVDSIKFQKPTMGSSWKTVDEVYKHLGVYTGQSATFGVNHTPSGITIPDGFLTWGGLTSGDTPEVSVTFSTPNFLEAVTVTCGSTTKSALVAVRDQPSGMGRTAYAALHAVYTAIALANDLIGTNVKTLEPFIWANAAYPGVQHNTVADAARHAYWSCLLTRYTVAGYAEGLTTAHEVSSPGPSTETVMDLHNNLMGIAIEGHAHTSGLGCCRTAVRNAVSTGTLWYLDSSYGAVNTAEDALLQPTNK
jgi:hypothetical protein